ncbi:MAG: glycosyltransferase family 2 protein, partial [Alphaproteobacteria bacterium]|nr:glycosyltransferase family 2 protein [Alphaproteobacteria bacterium]
MTQRIAAIIPSHDHHRAVPEILDALRQAGLRIFIVDDGSGEETAIRLGDIAEEVPEVTLLRLDENRGKGAAVMRGFEAAAAEGYSHALQIDADGQHELAALPRLLALAARHPDALVTGVAVFDRSAPLARRIGRWLTHVWVWIETLSFRVSDSMCGFRVYPLAPVRALLAEEKVGTGMDFDTEIMVRLLWRGLPVVETPVRVAYPPDNHSNFDILRDNLRISAMHARLFFGMLARQLPRATRRLRAPAHWASLPERGAYAALRLSALFCRWFGRESSLVLLTPAILYFLATGGPARRASRRFLERAFATLGATREPGLRDQFRHFRSFARRTIDALSGWTGDVPPERIRLARPEIGRPIEADPRGALLIVSHLGNADLARVRVR